jgi:acyl-CoA thioester hydrolase
MTRELKPSSHVLSSYSKVITVPPSVIDENGHVNNVAYVQWMQDIAIEHYSSLGGLEAQKPFGTWFARKHLVEYFVPAVEGEEIEIRTWVENVLRVRSVRRYEFVRRQAGELLVKGETEWVFVDTKSGKPRSIPLEVKAVFQTSNNRRP